MKSTLRKTSVQLGDDHRALLARLLPDLPFSEAVRTAIEQYGLLRDAGYEIRMVVAVGRKS